MLFGSVEGEPRLESIESRLGTPLLDCSQRRIEDQQASNDRGLDVLVEYYLKHNRSFEQPWNGSPELRQGILNRVDRCIWNRIRAVLFKTSLCDRGR